MSSSTRWFALSLAVVLGTASASATVSEVLPGARSAGSGRLTWFGLHVYDAQLFVGREFDADRYDAHRFALELTYARAFKGTAIAERSAEEIERLGFGSATERARWTEAMRALFPDVEPGQRLTGVHRPGRGVDFYFDHQRLGQIDDPGFGAAFFAIWLHERTPQPALRASLLGRAR